MCGKIIKGWEFFEGVYFKVKKFGEKNCLKNPSQLF